MTARALAALLVPALPAASFSTPFSPISEALRRDFARRQNGAILLLIKA